MPPHRRHDAAYLKERAVHARQLAALMKGSDAQAYMRRVANHYEILATRFQPQKAKSLAPISALTAADCHAHERRCREIAVHMGDLENTRQLEDMAEEWKLLALDC